MKKLILLLPVVIGILVGCTTYSNDHKPKEPKEVVTIYKDSGYTNVPGTTVTGAQKENIRTEAVTEVYYVGRYIDPNTGDMHGKGTVYRVVESPHWNTTPNHDPQPYETDAAYKHIKNLANASPLIAEADLKNNKLNEINNSIKDQIVMLASANEQIVAQAQNMKESQEKIDTIIKENEQLKKQNKEMDEKLRSQQNIIPTTNQNDAKSTSLKDINNTATLASTNFDF